jgi:hypothetical protein
LAFLRILLLCFLFTSNAFADWYILIPKKRPVRKQIPKNVPIPKLKGEKVQPKPYSAEINKILAPDFYIPVKNRKISKEELNGNNLIVIFVDNLFSPFTEALASKVEKLNLKGTKFIIISVNDSDFAFVETFKKLLHIKKTIVSADSYVFKQFKSKIKKISVPSMLIIDKYGFIRYFSPHIEGENTERLVLELNELLKLLNKEKKG